MWAEPSKSIHGRVGAPGSLRCRSCDISVAVCSPALFSLPHPSLNSPSHPSLISGACQGHPAASCKGDLASLSEPGSISCCQGKSHPSCDESVRQMADVTGLRVIMFVSEGREISKGQTKGYHPRCLPLAILMGPGVVLYSTLGRC